MDLRNYCPKCGNIGSNSTDVTCYYCGTKMIDTNVSDWDFVQTTKSMKEYKKQIQEEYIFKSTQFDKELFEKREAEEQHNFQENIKKMQYDADHPKCPKCGSTALSANKKGFGLGKAAVGGIMLGGVGLLGGFLGSGKIEITCLNCGNKFKPGDL